VGQRRQFMVPVRQLVLQCRRACETVTALGRWIQPHRTHLR